MTDNAGRETRAVRAAVDSDEQHGAVMPPIVLSTQFHIRGLRPAAAL